MILKISESIESLTRLGKGRVGNSGDSKARRDRSELDESEVDSGKVGNNEVGKKVQKLSKSKNLSKFKKMVGSNFLTSRARLAKLREAFIKASILHHFDLKRYIRIETDVSGYAISNIFSQLTLNDLGR